MYSTFIRKNSDQVSYIIYGKMPGKESIRESLQVAKNHPFFNTDWGSFFSSVWEYEYENGKPVDLTIDMEKARSYYMSFLRVMRDKVIEAYDMNTMKAMERNDRDRLQYIQKVKQALRDLPNTVDLNKAKTPEELYLIRPHILFGNLEGGEELLPEDLRNHPGEAKKYGW